MVRTGGGFATLDLVVVHLISTKWLWINTYYPLVI